MAIAGFAGAWRFSRKSEREIPSPPFLASDLRENRHALCWLLALATCAALFLAAVLAPPAHAVAGNVYAGKLVRCYRHPVTNVIEDAGGENAYATGQGMVEGCLSTKAQLEVTDDGQYFLTIRLGLIDYTSKRNFKVQQWGAKSWSKTKFAVSKKGKDNNGTTYDYCIKVPSQKCIVRMTMFVTPMGRSVVCYMYPKNLKKGHEKGMVAKIVTTSSKTSSASTLEGGNDNGSSGDSGGSGSTDKMLSGTTKNGSSSSSDNGNSTSSGTSSGSGSSGSTDSSSSSSASDQTGATGGASGLGLSTDDGQGSSDQSSDDQNGGSQGTSMSPLELFGVIAGAIVTAGVILLVIVLVVVWYIRTRKNGWNTHDPDDYTKAYAESLNRVSGDAPASAGSDDVTRRVR